MLRQSVRFKGLTVSLFLALGPAAFLASSAHGDEMPTDGLVAYYPFDGSADDASGNGNHGAVMGATLAPDRFGNEDSAYRFDGVDDWIEVESSPTVNIQGDTGLTIAAWVYGESVGGTKAFIVSKWGPVGSEDDQFSFKVDVDCRPFFVLSDLSTKIHSRAALRPHTWCFLAGVYDPDSHSISIHTNGVADNEKSVSFAIRSTEEPIVLGNGASPNQTWNGLIDDLRIYNRALSAEEIQALYQEGGWEPEEEEPSPGPGPLFGRALSFDGDGDRVDIPLSPGNPLAYPGAGGWSLEAWARPEDVSWTGMSGVVGQESIGPAGQDPFWLSVGIPFVGRRDVGGVLWVTSGSGTVASTTPVTELVPNEWVHLAGVYEDAGSAKIIRLYEDGILKSEVETSIVIDSRSTDLDPVQIGSIAGHWFDGEIDEVRIWSRALSQDEILANMDRPLEGNEDGLVGYWTFDELNASGLVPDMSGNGNHGTLLGDARVGEPGSTVLGNESFEIDPAAGQIAWTAFPQGHELIYLMDADGGNKTSLVDVTWKQLSVCWSPDGRQLAFASNRGSANCEIYVVDADGGEPRPLTSYAGWDFFPAWSPDGDWIAYVSDRDGVGDIYVMDAAGLESARVTRDAASEPAWHGNPPSPSWAPDSRRLAFGSGGEIWVIDRDGTNLHQVSTGPGWKGQPAWSPDGASIAYSSDGELYVMGADGEGTRRLTWGHDLIQNPDWSPDGAYLAFDSERAGNTDIYVLEVATTRIQRITFHAGYDVNPAWRPGPGHPAAPPSGNFALDLLATNDGGDAATLTLGQADDATDGIDPELGELELPPLPPTTVFDARFQVPGTNGSTVDLRPVAPDATWVIDLQAGRGGYPVGLSWDPEAFPSGSLRLQDAATGGDLLDVDMAAASSFAVEDEGLARLQFVYQRYQFTYELPERWSMVSVPCAAEDPSVSAMFPTAVSVFGFDGQYRAAGELVCGAGYWINLPASFSTNITGIPCQSLVLDLPAGDSMVGPGAHPVDVAALKEATGGNLLSVFGFCEAYYAAETMEPGQSYWVTLDQAGSLDLSGSDAPDPTEPEPGEDDFAGAQLWAESAGHRLTVDLGVTTDQVVALPPVPPAAMFDLRVEVDGVGAWQVPLVSTELGYRVHMQGVAAVLGWDVPEGEQGLWQLVVNGEAIELEGVGSVAVDPLSDELFVRRSPATAVLADAGDLLPQVSALTQNYPNPFNSQTVIHYAVSGAGVARLRIHGLTGQVVRELVSEPREAGYYQTVWDGRDQSGLPVANGVYFCELTAGDFRALRKMVLVK